MAKERVDSELEVYRNLMTVPDRFQNGFSFTSLVGAIFIAMIMVPGAMYMSLLAGIGVGPAAQWVTVILFIEVARRAHKRLMLPEIFVLYYMAGFLMVSPFFGLMWNQFFITSEAARTSGVAENLPAWYAPQDPLNEAGERTFFQLKWLPPILLIIFGSVVGRFNNIVLGYGLFRVTSDIEKLPFPMAPVGAQGIMALAEESAVKEGQENTGGWRWRIFSIGGVLGLVWGSIYLGLPTITGALFKEPVLIFPIPFADWTTKTQGILPAVPTGMSFDLGQLMFGMVLPFFAMLGSFVAFLVMVLANAFVLQPMGVLKTWNEGDDTLQTLYKNQIDFYFSFGIGLAAAIAIVGIFQAIRGIRRMRRLRRAGLLEQERAIPASRGDLKPWFIIVAYIVTTSAYIALSGVLLAYFSPKGSGGYLKNPGLLLVMVIFGFAYTPLISYVAARLEGMAGQMVDIPFVREAAFILSGYKGVEVWFLPIPLANYAQTTVFYRQAELTGTRFWSIWKAEFVLVPTVLVASIIFANFIWGLAPIPSSTYPFAERMWEYQARVQCIIYTSTMPGEWSAFREALNLKFIGIGSAVGLLAFLILGALSAPVTLMYGFVRGLNMAAMPHVVVPQFLGACISKFYFERRMGLRWREYVPVIAAGFMCGQGLISMLGIGVTFLAKAVFQLPF